MATAQDHEVSLKLIVHKTENKVIFAEADNHFADILFSFLTLPLGTITRLVEEQSDVGTGIKVGSLTNIYRSVADLDLKYFSTDVCKKMLLYPWNDAEAECRRLKVNIDDTEPTEYFSCDYCCRFSTYKNTCCLCGRRYCWSIVAPMRCNEGDIFFHKTTTLIISDDFSVMPSSSTVISELFNRLDITDVKLLSERVVHLGKKEILNLLKCSLISKTPLTDAFIRTGHKASEVRGESSNMTIPPMIDDNTNNTQQFTLKLFLRKSDNKILFAEANEDLINQIFSFLTIPLGAVLRLLGGTSTLGSVDQLYTSITNLQDLGPCLVSRFPNDNKLMHPKLPWPLSCEKQLLPLPVAAARGRDGEINPKLCPASTNGGGAFVKSPAARFIVNDDLVVKPISSLLSVAFLEHHIPKNGVEEKVVAFGIDQAYKLLKSSLLSESALTHALMDDLLKIPKTEK